MMRSAVCLLSLLVMVSSALAQEETPPPQPEPDYSRDSLLRLFADAPQREEINSDFEHRFGMLSFRALGMRWRVGYLPLFAPFPGSVVTTNRQWPDPFLLTGTEIASPPRTWARQREMSAELKRIERRLKKQSSVVVKP